MQTPFAESCFVVFVLVFVLWLAATQLRLGRSIEGMGLTDIWSGDKFRLTFATLQPMFNL